MFAVYHPSQAAVDDFVSGAERASGCGYNPNPDPDPDPNPSPSPNHNPAPTQASGCALGALLFRPVQRMCLYPLLFQQARICIYIYMTRLLTLYIYTYYGDFK